MLTEFPLTTIIKKFEGNMQPHDEKELQDWLDADAGNAKILDDLKIIWDDVQTKSSAVNPDVQHYWAIMQKHIESEAARPRILPMSRRLKLKTYLLNAAIITGLLLGGSAIVWMLNHSSSSHNEAVTLTYSALTGKSKFMLPDSTTVWLNTGSRIAYTDNAVREVTLEGEAYFNVTHNGKPFVVNTGNLDVTVHGTQFNVNAYADCATTVVSLFEGSVSMQVVGTDGAQSESVFLKPGEEGRFNKTDRSISIGEADGELAKAWTGDKLKVKQKNLRQVCSYLSEWYDVDITIDPATPNDQSYTFTLDTQSLDEVMAILKGISSIDYAYTSKNSITITPINEP